MTRRGFLLSLFALPFLPFLPLAVRESKAEFISFRWNIGEPMKIRMTKEVERAMRLAADPPIYVPGRPGSYFVSVSEGTERVTYVGKPYVAGKHF